MNEFSPIYYGLGYCYKVPAVYKKTSNLYEGYHEPFFVYPGALTADMEVRTRNYRN